MLGVKLKKARIDYVLECLLYAKPIEPPQEGGWNLGWRLDELLAVSAAFRTTAIRQGPGFHDGPREHLKAIRQVLCLEADAAIKFYGDLYSLAIEGEWEAHYEPEMSALIDIEDGQTIVRAIDGWKDPPDTEGF